MVRDFYCPNGSEEGELLERLTSAVSPSASLQNAPDHVCDEVIDILFDGDGDCSIEGFEEDRTKRIELTDKIVQFMIFRQLQSGYDQTRSR